MKFAARYRIPGHCEPVRFPGVAIPRIEVPPLMDEVRKTVQKNGLYDDGLLGFRWRFPHQSADWFGMTALFDAQSFLHKFQFVVLLTKADKHILFFKLSRRDSLTVHCQLSIPSLSRCQGGAGEKLAEGDAIAGNVPVHAPQGPESPPQS